MAHNLLSDSKVFNTLITNYIVKLVGLNRITKKFWYRWMAHGADYHDIVDTMKNVKSFEQWSLAWTKLASKYEQLATISKGLSAQNLYLKANVYYYLAQWAIFDVTQEKKEIYRKSKDCFKKASEFFTIPAEEVSFNYKDIKCPAYIRIPDGEGKKPCVVFIHGMDSSKEEIYWTEKEAVERGVATFYFDGPGQGENYILNDVLWEEDFDEVIKCAFDYVTSRPEIDSNNLYICGMSWGGFWALKNAANDDRIKGCCSLGGPPSSDHFEKLPLPIKMRFRKLFNKETENSRSEYGNYIFNKMKLGDDVYKIKCPTLIIHGKKDPLVPYQLIEDMYAKLDCDKTLKVYDDGDHCCTQYASEVRNIASDWMVTKFEINEQIKV
jgi:dipeptidyl aminopeptidase/acylaminoacyl peptidase